MELWSEMLERERSMYSGGLAFNSETRKKCITRISNGNKWLISVTYPLLVQFTHLLHILWWRTFARDNFTTRIEFSVTPKISL